MPPTRRRGASPDVEDLDALTAPTRLQKAAPTDPVLGLAGPTGARSAAPAAPPAPTPQRRTATKAENAAAPARNRVGIYISPDDAARARAAFDRTRALEDHRSFSEFMTHAVMKEVRRLEDKYNHGEPWPSLEAGQLPLGRPHGT